jgi:hypothetical protein
MSTNSYKHSALPHIYRYIEPEVLRDTIVQTIPRIVEISSRAGVYDVVFTEDNGLQLAIDKDAHSYEERLRNNMVWIMDEMMVHITENKAYMDIHGAKYNGSMKKRTFDHAECQSCIDACEYVNIDDIPQLIARVANIRIVEIEDYDNQ